MHLVPILTLEEANKDFLEKTSKGTKGIIVLIPAEFSSKESSALLTSRIARAQELALEIKRFLGKKRKHCEIILEWSQAEQAIIKIAKLKNISKIFLKKQDSKEFNKLVSALKKAELNIEIV